jgi:outer membrane protein
MRFIVNFLCFCIFVTHAYAEENLFNSLASSYLNNPQLNSQREKTKAVDETLIQAYSNFKPSIEGSAEIVDSINKNTTNYSGSAVSDSNSQTQTNSITITQKLFQGIPNAQKYKKAVDISRYELKNTEQEVLFKTIESFTEVLLFEKQVLINNDNLNLSDKQVELDKARYNKGLLKLSDLAQSEASLASAKAKLLSSKNDLAISKNNFKNIIGYEPKDLKNPNLKNIQIPQSLNDTISESQKQNVQLLISELKVKKAKYDYNSNIEDAFAPKASVSFKVSEYDEFSPTFDKRTKTEASAKVSIPVYSGGKGYSLVKEKQALKISAELDYEDAKNNAVKVASSSWSNFKLSESKLELAKAQLKASEIAYEGIIQEYESGQRTTLDVLNSRGLLLAARLNLINSEREQILSTFNLLKVTGNLTANYLNLEARVYDPKEVYKKSWIRHIF